MTSAPIKSGTLTNRLREQFRRYYPQMLQLGSDLAEEWIFALWEKAPAPAKAARLRQTEVEKLLKRHRIRRIGAAEVLAILKQPALVVAPGVTEAAVAHIRVLIESIRLFTQQLKEMHRQLDRLCNLLAEPMPGRDEKAGPEPEQTLVAILQSLPGAGRIVLAVLLAEAFETLQRADYAILRMLCGVAPVPGGRAKAGPSPGGLPAIQGYGMPYTTWRMPRDGPTRSAKPNILL